MKKRKIFLKILCFSVIFSVLLSVLIIPCFAYTYTENDYTSPDGYVGIPFEIQTLGNTDDFGQFHSTRFIDSNFGSLFYEEGRSMSDSNYGANFPIDLNIPGGAFKFGSLWFWSRPQINSSHSPWYSNVSFDYLITPYTNTTYNIKTAGSLSDAQNYADQYFHGALAIPFVDNYNISYDGIISTSLFPSTYSSNAYFPIYFDVSRWVSYNSVVYDSNGLLSSPYPDLPDSPLVISVSFDYSSIIDDEVVWTHGTRQLTYSKSVFGTVIGAHSRLDTFNNVLYQYGNLSILSYRYSMIPIYNSIVNYIGSSTYIKNLSIYIQGVDYSDDLVPPAFDTYLRTYIRSKGGAFAPLYEFSLGYDGASGDYHGIEGNFDNYLVTRAVYLGDFNLVSWLGSTLSGIMDISIIGDSITLGSILYVCVGLGVLMLILKIFAGG